MSFRERRVKRTMCSVYNAGNFLYFSPKWFLFTVQCTLTVNKSPEYASPEYAGQETTPAFY